MIAAYVTVPIEPTDSMIEAGEEEIAERKAHCMGVYASDVYNAMIKACRSEEPSPSNIVWSLSPEDIEWHDEGGNDGKGEAVFEKEMALAHLLINRIVYLNSGWWRQDIPEDARLWTHAFVACNDVFDYSTADGVDLPHNEIENLYTMWQIDPVWGPAVWCMIQRKQKPIKEVADSIKKMGIWNLDEFDLK